MKKWLMILLFSMLFASFLSPLLIAQDDSTLFRDAKILMYQRDYVKAINSFELIRLKHPNSRYIDDAEFWSAYILEQQGKETDAFMSYQDMINKYPSSPWVDDAMVHQIGLAEKFIQGGQESYKNFLTDKLESPYTNVKYQASLSLGKLGDERAIPALKEMENNGDRDMRSMATLLLKNFDQSLTKEAQPLKPGPKISPRIGTDRRDDALKQPGMKPQKERRSPNRQPDIKIMTKPSRQQPGSQPKKSTPPSKAKKIN